MVTGSTLGNAHLLSTDAHKRIVQDELFLQLEQAAWRLEAWAVLSNHYHFVAVAPEKADISTLMKEFHRRSAQQLNQLDGKLGRRVWFQFWDSQITHEKSYFARLAYVHQNAVRHGAVLRAENYEFCSMSWFVANAEPAFRDTIRSFPIDNVNVIDNF